MPAIVGIVQVINVGSSSIVNIGDVYKVMPISTAKTFAGSGSFNTGDGLRISNQVSTTNVFDQDGIDQGNLFNA
ncbi:spore germination protein [Cytobacillus sp. Hz8]|uniref:spore germination protein n=1 Tax=Cytobacillus sp. Hz8 TaxID=3347168 RepID=UPI0035E34D24